MSAAVTRTALDQGRLRARVAAGDTTLGTFLGTASPLTAEVCAASGFDWVLLDLEHGAGGEEQIGTVVPVAASYGVPTIVRVESAERLRIGRVLDSGATGIMLPRMNSAAEVNDALVHFRYSPNGDRGIATYNRSCRFGLDPGALDVADDQILAVIQIESARAVDAVDEIAAIEGVHVLFVGPRDLSHDLGVPGDVKAPIFVEAMEHVLAAAKRNGKGTGVMVNDGATAAARIAQGWNFIAIGSDSALLAAAATAQLAQARAAQV